jgi:hypothetical protein
VLHFLARLEVVLAGGRGGACPMRMLQFSAAEIRRDAERLLAAVGDTSHVGLCCTNMDYCSPDENVPALLGVAASAG